MLSTTGMFILSAIALLIIAGLLICFLVISSVNKELLTENEVLRNTVIKLKDDNKSLKYEVDFQKKVSKTFSDGLEALTNKK